MAPRKKPVKGRPKAEEKAHSIAMLKGSDELEEWLDGLVLHANLRTRSLTLWHGLNALADRLGYDKPMPKR